jgi:hypothetical protein
MDIYGHLMETVNHEAAGKLGKTVLGEKKIHHEVEIKSSETVVNT